MATDFTESRSKQSCSRWSHNLTVCTVESLRARPEMTSLWQQCNQRRKQSGGVNENSTRTFALACLQFVQAFCETDWGAFLFLPLPTDTLESTTLLDGGKLETEASDWIDGDNGLLSSGWLILCEEEEGLMERNEDMAGETPSCWNDGRLYVIVHDPRSSY